MQHGGRVKPLSPLQNQVPMNLILPPAYDNESAHRQLKQLMEQGRNLSIKLDNKPNAWISTPNITGLRYQLNTDSWKWIVNYLTTGSPDDFRVFPSKLEQLPDFQLAVLTVLVEAKQKVHRIPFLRETQSHINLIAIFKFGRVYFRIKRTDTFTDSLNTHNI